MDKLKPCPFCGSPAHMWEWNGGCRIDCSEWSERHYVGVEGETREEAIKLWNRRVNDERL